MDFSLTEQQEMLKRAAREYLKDRCPKSLVRQMEKDERGYPLELWHDMAEMGWLGLPFPQEYGGGDGSFLDLLVLLEEMGRALAPVPYISTVVLCGLAILDGGTAQQKQEYLPGIASGKLIMALALTEPGGGYQPQSIGVRATQQGKGFLVSGTKLFVADAREADYFLLVTRTANRASARGITLFIVDARSPGITVKLLPTIANDGKCEVVFHDVKVPEDHVLGSVDRGWGQALKIMARGAVAECAYMLGGEQQVLETTMDYAKQRVQFGHPIGSFQAVQHRIADMALDVYASRYVTYRGGWKIAEGLPFSGDVSTAKAWVSDAYRRVVMLGHESHATISYTQDYDLQLYFRRAKKSELAFGDAEFHRELVAQELGL